MLNMKLIRKPPPDMAVCRVCTGRGRQLVPFARFDAERKAYRLADAIYAVCGVRVASGDGLPQHCCVRCLRDIETGYKVQQRCRESNTKLLAIHRLKVTLAALKGGGLPESEEARWEDPAEVKSMDPLVDVGEIKTETEGDFEELHFKEEIEEARLQEPLEEVSIKQEPTDDVEEVAECHDKEEESKEDNEEEEFYEVMEIVESTDDEEGDVATGPIGGFKCCSCKQSFLSIRELEEHVRIVDNVYSPQEVDIKVQCKVYTASVLAALKMNGHIKYNNYEYRPRENINRRRSDDDVKEKSRICCGCSKYCESPVELIAHSQEMHYPQRLDPDEQRPLACDICYQNFATRNDLFEHKKQFRKEGKKYPCTECGDGFFTFKSLQMHRKYHRPDVTNCHMCPFVSNCPLKLRSHIQRHCTLNDTFKCLVCAKCFSTSSILAKHSAKHPIKTKFKCPHCPRMFNYDKCLKRHIERHVREGSVVEQTVADEEEMSE
ncbi:zinc finger protein 226-like [Culex pipiens pallens]|uniref:zinc finger protein 226-like n=1 Tax=Culex pipiens pallens TaxID=42434 RepID=UPI001954F51D|nr:zinc finger protein 226-like [Culex pipiens pallens]